MDVCDTYTSVPRVYLFTRGICFVEFNQTLLRQVISPDTLKRDRKLYI